jgi:hypothetical protein
LVAAAVAAAATAAVAATILAVVQQSGGNGSGSNYQSSVDVSVAAESGSSCKLWLRRRASNSSSSSRSRQSICWVLSMSLIYKLLHPIGQYSTFECQEQRVIMPSQIRKNGSTLPSKSQDPSTGVHFNQHNIELPITS